MGGWLNLGLRVSRIAMVCGNESETPLKVGQKADGEGRSPLEVGQNTGVQSWWPATGEPDRLTGKAKNQGRLTQGLAPGLAGHRMWCWAA